MFLSIFLESSLLIFSKITLYIHYDSVSLMLCMYYHWWINKWDWRSKLMQTVLRLMLFLGKILVQNFVDTSKILNVSDVWWWWSDQIFYTSISAGTSQQKVSQDLPKMLYLNYSPVKGYLISIRFTNSVKDQSGQNYPTLNWSDEKRSIEIGHKKVI